MMYAELYKRMARACVSFILPIADGYRVWSGAYFTPGHIITCSHAFSLDGKTVVRESMVRTSEIIVVNIDGQVVDLQKVEFPQTGDVAIVTMRQNWTDWIPLGNPQEVPIGDLVYLWAYPTSYTGYTRKGIESPSMRWPNWGMWVLGWWEGRVAEGPMVEGRDYRILCPSARGQSGAPCIWLRRGTDPVIVGTLSLTQSVSLGSFMESSYTYLTGTEHVLNLPLPQPKPTEELVRKAKPYVIPVLAGAVVGGLLLSGR